MGGLLLLVFLLCQRNLVHIPQEGIAMALGILLLTVRIEMASDLGRVNHQTAVNKVHQLTQLRIVLINRLLQLMVVVQQAEVKLGRIACGTLYVLHLGIEHALLKHMYQLLRHVVVDVVRAGKSVAHVVQPFVESLANTTGRSRVQITALLLFVQPYIRLVLMAALQLTADLRQHIAQPAQRLVHLLCLLQQIVPCSHQFPRQHLFGHHVEVHVHVGIQHSLLPHVLQHLFRQGLCHLHNVRHHAYQPVFRTCRGPLFPQTGKLVGNSSQYIFHFHS